MNSKVETDSAAFLPSAEVYEGRKCSGARAAVPYPSYTGPSVPNEKVHLIRVRRGTSGNGRSHVVNNGVYSLVEHWTDWPASLIAGFSRSGVSTPEHSKDDEGPAECFAHAHHQLLDIVRTRRRDSLRN